MAWMFEHGIGTQLGTTGPDVGCCVVAEHHHLFTRISLTAGSQYPQTAALFQKQVNDGEIPGFGVGGEP